MPPTNPEPALFRTVAPAKINWTLEVLGRRPDGYHEIRSVMQTISLADVLTAVPAAGPRTTVEVYAPEYHGEDLSDNTVLRAASLAGRVDDGPVTFRLEKMIPLAAGLGGGSSDAAAALRLLRRLWSTASDAALRRVAKKVGSDVPFFLRGGVQLVGGRGETVRPVRAGPAQILILATPPIAVPNKTARLYAAISAQHYADGAATMQLVERLRAGAAPREVDYVNVFDAVAGWLFPDFDERRREFGRLTGLRPLLAGAGPSLFGVLGDDAACLADALVHRLREAGFRAWAVRTTSPPQATFTEVPAAEP